MRPGNRIGVALFVGGNIFSPEGNFYCEYRGQPVEFGSASDLPAQTLWITNSSMDGLYQAGLARNPKIAHEGYFRTRLSQMVQELGIGHLSQEQQVSLLAGIVGDAAEMAKLQFGFTQYPSNGLAQGVGQIFGIPESPQGSALLQVAEGACQQYTSCERSRRHEKADIFSFWLPRHAHANDLLAEPLPLNDALKTINPHSLPNMGRDARALVDWAKENSLPLFARIRIKALEPTVGMLVNYGAGAVPVKASTTDGSRYDSRNMREWCSLPELDVLSEAGDVEILQVAVSGGWMRSEVHLRESRASAVSYSYCLVAENLWVGLTRRPSADGKVSRTLGTAWLQAQDRMRCLRIAERLYGIGMEIINYGYGRITVACPASVRALIPGVARENSLLYPAFLEGLTHYPPQRSLAHEVMQSLLNTRDYPNIVRANTIALGELEAVRHEA